MYVSATDTSLREPSLDACNALGYANDMLTASRLPPEQRDALRRFIRADMALKSELLDVDIQRGLWERLINAALPERVRRRLGDSRLPTSSPPHENDIPRASPMAEDVRGKRVPADVCIVTIIQEEHDAVLRAFGIDPASAPEMVVRGGKFHSCTLKRAHQNDLKVMVTMIGQARNGPCINVCRDIFDVFSIGACILVGIAGGRRGKVQYGDVVAAAQVRDIEGGKSVLTRFLRRERVIPRPKDYVPRRMQRFVQNFNPLRHNWHQAFARVMSDYKEIPQLKPISEEAWAARPTFHHKDIVVGEKVLANGKLPKIARDNDDIFAVEMEGSGFASACDHCDVPWMIIRGITDYADSVKKDGWHVPASVAAATATRVFLEHEYRNEELRY